MAMFFIRNCEALTLISGSLAPFLSSLSLNDDNLNRVRGTGAATVCQPKSREPVSQQTGAAGNEDGR
jgi:hypothetical protein